MRVITITLLIFASIAGLFCALILFSKPFGCAFSSTFAELHSVDSTTIRDDHSIINKLKIFARSNDLNLHANVTENFIKNPTYEGKRVYTMKNISLCNYKTNIVISNSNSRNLYEISVNYNILSPDKSDKIRIELLNYLNKLSD